MLAYFYLSAQCFIIMVSELVSVILIFDGSEKTCDKCISSISNQTYPNIELILAGKVMPNHSSDCSLYSFVPIDCKTKDLNSLFDQTVCRVHGKYVLMLNSNCWIYPECIEHLLNKIIETQKPLLLVGYYYAKSLSAIVKLPDVTNNDPLGTYPFFFVHSSFQTSSELTKKGQSDICVLKDPLILFTEHYKEPSNHHLLMDLYYYVRRIMFNYVNRKLIQENVNKMKELKGKYAGKRCFIVGNGPSLRTTDLDKLCGEYTFAMNYIMKLYGKTLWRPTFFAISDERVMIDYSDRMPSSEAEYSFFKLDYKKYVGDKESNPIVYRAEPAFFDGFPPNFSEDASNCVYCSATVTYICIQLAFYFGFSEIILLGMDHSYPIAKTKDGVRIKRMPGHCYEDQYHNGDELFYAGVDVIEPSYEYGKDFLEKHGIKIVNATRGGDLEIFERRDFDTLFD